MSKSFLKLTAKERDIEAQKLETEFTFEQTRPLSPRSRSLWKMAKRGRGRPRKSADEKARRILVSMEPGLLLLIEKFTAATGIDRSKLFALSVKAFIAADEAHRQAFAEDDGGAKPRRVLANAHPR
jgi:hypothetical protein